MMPTDALVLARQVVADGKDALVKGWTLTELRLARALLDTQAQLDARDALVEQWRRRADAHIQDVNEGHGMTTRDKPSFLSAAGTEQPACECERMGLRHMPRPCIKCGRDTQHILTTWTDGRGNFCCANDTCLKPIPFPAAGTEQP